MSAVALRPDIDARVRVGIHLCEAAGLAIRDRPADRIATIEWLAGEHPGWDGFYAVLTSDLRDPMERAAGDLAAGMPGAALAASELLLKADGWLCGVTG